MFVELPVQASCGQGQNEGLYAHLNRYRKSIWENEQPIQDKVPKQVRNREKLRSVEAVVYANLQGRLGDRVIFCCDQTQGKGVALSTV